MAQNEDNWFVNIIKLIFVIIIIIAVIQALGKQFGWWDSIWKIAIWIIGIAIVVIIVGFVLFFLFLPDNKESKPVKTTNGNGPKQSEETEYPTVVPAHETKYVDRIKEELEEYVPPAVRDEKEFERTIYAYLKGKLGDVKIEFQKVLGKKGRIDMVIDDEIGVELKVAESRSHLRNLIGQIEEYLEDFNELLIVILDVGYLDKDIIEEYVDKFESKDASVLVMKGRLKRHNSKRN